MIYDYLIVGAGLAGSVLAERIATKLKKFVLLIDQREHIAGNVYDYKDENGMLIHKYGPHIFHSSNKNVWDYLHKFTTFNNYQHKVVAVINDKFVPIPFNLNSIKQCFSKHIAKKLESKLINAYGLETKIPILKLRESNDDDIKELAEFIYQNVFLGYNLKQWGLRPEELDFNVSSRVPVFISTDDRYFQEFYQGLPENGYTDMVNKMIDNKRITVMTNTSLKDIENTIKFDKLIFTGPIDSFFDYQFGLLPYRSLKFGFEKFDVPFYQPNAQVNYPNDNDYTRITEFKHFYADRKFDYTTIAKEYPIPFILNENEPYYPIPTKENAELLNKYIENSKKLKSVFFVGRLAEYKYYNMDQIVGVALQTFEKKIAN